MKAITIIGAAFLLVSFAACENNSGNSSNVQNPTLFDNNQSAQPATANAGSNTVANGTEIALNPEHGKPGHRCDLPVGAPLNGSAPATQSNNQIITVPSTNTAAADQSNAAPTNGLNPEHGKPGHRCDIAVGAPLNSKPQ